MRDQNERVEQSTPMPDRIDVDEPVERVRTQLKQVDMRVRRLVQERPLVAASAALVLGYALGRMLKWR